MRLHKHLIAAMMLASFPISAVATDPFVSPDILVLGDSQISFGSGPAFVDFFSNIERNCQPSAQQLRSLRKLGDMNVGVIGVRSTSLGSWTARSGPGKDAICEEDKKWKVNAGSYGVLNTAENKFVQIGKGGNYQFCAPKKSAFETMFRDDYYDPKLLFMTFLGNSATKWANSVQAAEDDVRSMMKQLPQDTPCIFMTTAPAHTKKIVDLRLRAQANLEIAFEKTGSRCSFVEGATPETIAANLGNARHFRRNKNGAVKDPFHPNTRAAKMFFKLQKHNICTAIFDQLG